MVTETGSDSAAIDNALEFLIATGRSLPHAMMMLIPEAWSKDIRMDAEKQAFYEYHACLMEPWDGPAAIAFTDGKSIGAVLDRNGLRPARYVVTKNNLVIMASEVGVLDIPPEEILYKGRLQPGKLFLVDTAQGRIVDDSELKAQIVSQKPYSQWLKANKIYLKNLPEPELSFGPNPETLLKRQQAFGYSVEDLRLLMAPMAQDGEEAVGSMGTDTPLAVLSNHTQLLYNYFKQLFAQVTNPPIDSIREEMVMSLETCLGSEKNLLGETPEHCRMVSLSCPVLTDLELEKIRRMADAGFRSITLPMVFPVSEGEAGLERAVSRLCQNASEAIREGCSILILSDRNMDAQYAPIPSLLASSAVHHHLVREGTRTKAGLVVESGEVREVMHFALLIGYGAGAVNPYLAFETISDMVRQGLFSPEITQAKAHANYVKSLNKALLKIIAKMGISTIQSYRGAQIFEAIGLNSSLVEHYFTGTPSRVEGIGIEVLAREALQRHRSGYPDARASYSLLGIGGQYQWRRGGEFHLFNPETIAKLQHSVRQGNYKTYREYCRTD